jgi:hypothetical protein
LRGNSDLVDRAEKTSLESFGREYNIFTNLVQRHMCFSFTAHLAWSGQKRSNAILIAMLAKGYAILIWWWAGILAFGEVDNNNFFEFPS